MKGWVSKYVYGGAVLLIAASWIYNWNDYRTSRLPEGGFLKHHIEAQDTPAVAFDLYYVANNDDPRKPVGVTVEGLPSLRFYPASEYMSMKRQTIYRFMGYNEASDLQPKKAEEPFVFHEVTLYYSQGPSSKENIGEAIVYRNAYPPASGKPLFNGVSGSSSSNNTGSETIRLNRPAALEGVTSAWLDELGTDFQFDASADGYPAGLDELGTDFPFDVSADRYPIKLEKGSGLTIDYRFLNAQSDSRLMEPYNLLLKARLIEENGVKSELTVFANYAPWPTEAQMKAYVKQKRREAE